MNKLTRISALLITLGFLAGPVSGLAAENAGKKSKAKPYTLKTCVVSDEKLGDMGKPYTFEYEGREIKMCCKSCKKDFDKDPKKYIKKLEEAEAKAKK